MKIKLVAFIALSGLVLYSCANIGIGTKTGAVGGALAGGAACSKFAEGKYEIIAGCTVIGVLLGAWIGSKWDEKDEKEAMNILNTYADGETFGWKNPDTQNKYSMTPIATYQNKLGQHCRQFKLIMNGNDKKNGQACRNKETGRWKLTMDSQ